MTAPLARSELRDAIHAAFGSPKVTPSMFTEIERQFEALEETEFEKGVAHVGLPGTVRREQEKFLEAVLDELEKTNPGVKFDRARVERAVCAVRNEEYVPF